MQPESWVIIAGFVAPKVKIPNVEVTNRLRVIFQETQWCVDRTDGSRRLKAILPINRAGTECVEQEDYCNSPHRDWHGRFVRTRRGRGTVSIHDRRMT